MGWLAQRVWQLGIAVVLTLLGAWLIYVGTGGYVGTVGRADEALLWIGLALVFVAMAIPLLSKLYEATQEARGEEGET